MHNPEHDEPQFTGGDMQENHFQFRASLAQKRLWLHEQLGQDPAIYHISTVLELEGELDETALQLSVNDLVARHESFRTHFIWHEETLFQRCHESLTLPLEKVDMVAADEVALQAQLDAANVQPFNLKQAPLARFVLFRCDANRHLLLIVLHHIISDGWSAGIISRELAACYNARRQGWVADLPSLEIQYIDYSEWQHQQQERGDVTRALAWWCEKLRDVEPIDLPSDRPRPNRLSLRGKTRFFTLPQTLAQTLGERARARNSTLYSLLLSAFSLILHRYSGQRDLTIGSPVSGRERLELEGVVGFFVNTLVYRIQIDPQECFTALQQTVFHTVVEALEHQQVSFDRLVETLNPARDLSYSPLFQVMFSFDEGSQQGWLFDGLNVKSRPLAGEQAKFDLTLSMESQGQQLQGAFEYSSDLFDDATIAQLEADFLFLLGEIARDDNQKLACYPCLTARNLYAEPRRTFPVDQALHQRFEAQAQYYPDAVAIGAGAGHKLTYHQLNVRANQLAHYLRLGMQDEPAQGSGLVGICMDRNEDLPIAILAVLKAGMAYLPVDSGLGKKRARFYVEDAGVHLVMGASAHQPLFDDSALDYLCTDSESSFIQTMPETNPDIPVAPDALAYVIYTSGSTGTPKGVEITHANVMRLFAASERHFTFSEHDVWTLFHSSAFDFSVWEIWGALLYGGQLSVVPFWVSRSPELFRQWVSDEQVTVLNQTPSAFTQFIAADAASHDATPLALRYVIMGGETLEPAMLLNWLKKYGEDTPQIINMYGITETTVHVTWRRITLTDTRQSGKSPIGEPLDDLEIYLLDTQQRPVPPGVVGEMYVGGAGVARGYRNRPALTRERFLNKAALLGGEDDGARLYRSGDLARRRRDGSLEYLGRADHQVKIRGFRIEPGEIEVALQRLDGVEQAVVLARTNSDDRQVRLIAWVATRAKDLNVETLRNGLRRTLPDYMLPSAFVFMAALPLTANGKLDRHALPDPQTSRPQLASRYQPARTDTEAALLTLWRDVLKVEEIGIHDNFFSLGGDSLRGVQLVGRGRERGLGLTLVNLFQHQTVAELAALLDACGEQNVDDAATATPFSQIVAEDRARLPPEVIDAYPLSRMQAGMFYHMNLAPDANIYHCTGTSHLRINAPFNETAFRQAVAETVATHDVLRTSFDFERYSQPLQLVWPWAALPIVVEDLRHLDRQQQEDRIKALLDEERRTPFDLHHPTLLRFFIQHRSAQSFQFTMTECHPVFDGWSYHTMIVEVFNRYAVLTGNSQWQPPVRPRQEYRDFIVQEQAAIRDETQRHYWQQTLADCTLLRLPRQTKSAAPNAAPCLKSFSFTLDESLYQGMRQLMLQLGVPLKSVLLAGHIKVMSVFSGERDILTGIPTNGRPEAEGGDWLYGLYLNILPFRQVLTSQSWAEVIRQTFANECAAIPHRCYPLAEIQRHFGPQPLLDEVLFNYMDFHIYDQMSPALELEVVDKLNVQDVHEGTHFTLNVHFQHKTLSSALASNQVSAQLDYNANVLTQEQVALMAACYQRVLAAMIAEPQSLHHATDFIPAGQQSQLITFTRGPTGYTGPETLATLFARQVMQQPDASAVEWDAQRLSYSELDQRSDLLALRLTQQGVARGSHVALYLGRDIGLIISVLAISKLEAVYLPLNPEDPHARLVEQITDAHCCLLITHQLERSLAADTGLPQLALAGTDLSQSDAPVIPVVAGGANSLPLYVMYTSGSTGKAKGVLIPQQGVIRLVKQVNYLDFNQHHRCLMLASVSFDASTLEIWGPLLNGGTIIIYPQGAVALPQLEKILIEQQVESLFLTTSLFNLIVDECPQMLRQVRQVISGGEAMSLRHADHISSLYPDLTLINGYGPTENTTFTTSWRYQANASDIAPIGKPNEGNITWILDPFMQPTPVGTPGELYIGGPGLALAYINQPERYRQCFIANHFDPERSASLYRTGDRARYQPDGTIEYLGRFDKQCKIRGFRVETGEIEATLCQHPSVDRAAVQVVEDPKGKRIVAWLVMRSTCPFDAAALRTWLLQSLPHYMIPARFHLLDALPLTANGKLDVSRLHAEDCQPTPASTAPVVLTDTTAKAIQQVWSAVLGVVTPGQQENFFDLGGDSLLLARVHLRLTALGYSEVSIIDLLNYPTIQQLADYLNAGQRQPEANLDAIQLQVSAGRSRLAGLQQRRSGK